MRQSAVGGEWKVPSIPWLMLRICSFSVLESFMRHYLFLVLMYGSETMLWKERKDLDEAVQMDNLKRIVGY